MTAAEMEERGNLPKRADNSLNKFGFGAQEIADYFCLAQRGQETKTERIRMLTRQRRCILDEIHQKEK